MTRTKSTYLALLAVLLSPMAANADLIDAGGTTIDTASGLEWLDLIETVGLSYNAVLSSSFVTVEGYRYATEAEVFELYTNAGGTPSQNVNFLAGNVAPAQLLLDLLGCTSYLVGNPCDGVPEDWGAAMWGSSSEYLAIVDNHPNGGVLATRWFPWGDDDNSFRADIGSYLVREAVVPEPGTLALLGLGLFGIGLARRKV